MKYQQHGFELLWFLLIREAIKPKKIVGQSLFKNNLKFQSFNKVFYCDTAKCMRK